MGSPITAMAVGPDHILGDHFDSDDGPNFYMKYDGKDDEQNLVDGDVGKIIRTGVMIIWDYAMREFLIIGGATNAKLNLWDKRCQNKVRTKTFKKV